MPTKKDLEERIVELEADLALMADALETAKAVKAGTDAADPADDAGNYTTPADNETLDAQRSAALGVPHVRGDSK